MAKLNVTLDRAALHELLQGTDEFSEPEAILCGLTAQQACSVVAGLPYSIAQLVAHMNYWQDRRCAFARGEQPGDFEWAKDDWPAVSAEQWPAVLACFSAGLAQLEASATPEAVALELYRGRSGGFMLASAACHNAYHLGQIVLLRRLLGCWPPAEGGYDMPV